MTARALLVRLGLALGLAGNLHAEAAAARAVPVDKAPASWVRYGKEATAAITTRLNGDAPPAPRMREALTRLGTKLGSGQSLPPLVLAIWIAPGGKVSKVDARPTGDAQADADLRALLLGHGIGNPPKDMLQPLRLAVHLAAHKAGGRKA